MFRVFFLDFSSHHRGWATERERESWQGKQCGGLVRTHTHARTLTHTRTQWLYTPYIYKHYVLEKRESFLWGGCCTGVGSFASPFYSFRGWPSHFSGVAIQPHHTHKSVVVAHTHTHRHKGQQNNGYCRKYYWEKSRHPWRIRNFPAMKNFQHIRLGTRFGLRTL